MGTDGRWGLARLAVVVVVVVVASGLVAAPAAAVPDAPRIMPLGDSITEGADGQATYRYGLHHALHDAGVAFDLVGSRHGVRDGTPSSPDFDQDHEGHTGWRVDQVLDGRPVARSEGRLADWVAAHDPDVALVHLGTNDIRQCQTPASTASELSRVVATLRAANPEVAVLVAQIIPTTGNPARACASAVPARVVDLNARIAGLAAELSTATSPVVAVDQHTGFDVTTDTYDGVHPDAEGEQKLAARWADAVLALLGQPPAPTPPPPPPTGVGIRGVATSTASTGKVVALPRPGGTEAGDLLLAGITVQGDQTVTVPTGWALVPGSPAATGPESSRARQYVAWRVAAPDDPATFEFARTGYRHAAVLVALSGVDAGDPVLAAAAATVPGASSGIAPGVDVPVAGAAVVRLVGLRNGSSSVTTVAPPAEVSELADVGVPYVAGEAAWSTASAAGAVPGASFTFSRTSQAVLSTVALRPGG